MIDVLVITETWPPAIGGGAVHAFEIVRGLRKRGHTITVLHGGQSFHLFARCAFLFTATIRGLFVQCDLIHAHAFLGAIPGKIIAWVKRVPVILTVHGTRLHTDDAMGHGFFDRFFLWLEKRILLKTRYDAQISVDEHFFRLLNVNKKTVVIPNGVDIGRFDSVERKKYDPPVVLFVGRLHVQKGVPYLLEAFARIRKKIHAQLWIIGDGPERFRLQEIVRKKGMEGDVRFWGAVGRKSIIPFYKKAHVFVLPSIYEGSPLTLFEAWAAKLPVIVTDVGDNARMVTNKINGYVIPPKNIFILSRVLSRVLTSPSARSMGEAGYKRAKQEYSWENAINRTVAVYTEVLSCRKSA